jgi:hypothetical protein
LSLDPCAASFTRAFLHSAGDHRLSHPTPTPGGFWQRVRNHLKIKELSFTRVQKSSQEYESKGDSETSERRNVCRSACPRAEEYPPPRVFVSVASKGFSDTVSCLESTLRNTLTSVASKGLDGGPSWLKTGKTRCLSASADSKRFKGIAEQGNRVAGEIISKIEDGRNGVGVRVEQEFGDRRGWNSTNTEEYSTP